MTPISETRDYTLMFFIFISAISGSTELFVLRSTPNTCIESVGWTWNFCC